MQNELDCLTCDGTYKGLDCGCCKKSPQIQSVLDKINSLMGKSVSTTTEQTIDQLKALSSELSQIGGIEEIVKISEVFLNIPLEKLKIEQLQLDDINKTIDLTTGNIKLSSDLRNSNDMKVSSLCDIPSIDMTKIIDFSKLGNLSELKKLKFSVSVPAIVIEKTMNFGIISIELSFHIHRKGFSWFPTFGSLKTREEAIEKLRKNNISYTQPVIPVDKVSSFSSNGVVSLDEAKFLVSQQYSDSLEVANAIKNINSASDFFNRMTELGIPITKEINPLDDVQKFIDKEEELIQFEKLSKGIISDSTPCGLKPPASPLIPKPFMDEDLKKIEQDCCSQPSFSAEEVIQDIIPDTLSLLESLSNPITDVESAQAVKDVEDFMNEINSCSKNITSAVNQKNNAINNWYYYTEIFLLNKIAWKYAEKRIHVIDMLMNNVSSIIQSRHNLILRNIELASQRSTLITKTYNEMLQSGAIYNDYTSNIQFSLNSVIIYSTTYQSMLQNSVFASSIKMINDEFNSNESKISVLSGKINNLKNSNGIPTLSSTEIAQLKLYGIDSLLQQTKDKKEIFSAISNPISNQVGYGGVSSPTYIQSSSNMIPVPGYVVSHNIELLHLFVDPHIYQEAKALFDMNAVTTGEITQYIVTADKRERLFGNVWNKFYSSNRIDNLFSYKEQGYTTPKPVFDNNGKPLGPETNLLIKDYAGNIDTQKISASLVEFDINKDIAIEFWTGASSGDITGSDLDIEAKIKNKIMGLLGDVEHSTEYNNFIDKITLAAEMEAKLVYAANLIWEENSYETKTYNAYTSTYTTQTPSIYNNSFLNNSGLVSQFRGKYWLFFDAIDKFQLAIQEKLSQLNMFIEHKKLEIADGEDCIAKSIETLRKKSEALNKKTANKSEATMPTIAPTKKICKDKLGYDPFGIKIPLGCPDYTKNCYWKEYTNIMQTISLMPIIDSEKLSKRLFRYYPVGLQLPVLSPTGVLPTLASGIPDALISIPMPIIWKHVSTMSTPIGTFVIWIALTGVIPCPFVMMIDEKMEACFLSTLKGPIAIPAKSLNITKLDDKALIDVIKPFDELLNVDITQTPWKFLFGNNKIKFSKNPDDANAFIDKIQSKIKSSVNGLNDMDWSLASALGVDGPQGPQSAFSKNKERLRNAFKHIPPDVEIIEKALTAISDALDSQVDSIKISPIKIPKDPKKLITPVIGPSEFVDDINKLKDQGLDLSDLGATLKVINLRTEIKKLIDRELSEPEVKTEFVKIDREISELEQSMKLEGLDNNIEDIRKKIKKRTQKIKKIIKVPLKRVADKISPEMLGIIASVSVSIPLPTPCYESKPMDPIPPYILTIIDTIKSLPDLIDSISDDVISNKLQIDLSAQLPSIDDMIWFIVDAIINIVVLPISYPDPKSVKLLNQVVKSAIQNIFKTKIRMPHLPGVVQITITESMIKTIIKTAIHSSFILVIKILMEEIEKAAENKNIAMVVAIGIIIKAIVGTDLSDVGGNEIKSMLTEMLEAVDDALDELKPLVKSFESINTDFKSIKDKLFPTIPPNTVKQGPFIQLLTSEEISMLADPLFEFLANYKLPLPVILTACTIPTSRSILTKIHPFMSKELLPPWEKMSTSNIPFVIWLDQLIATAQKQGGFGSDYVAPYWLPDV